MTTQIPKQPLQKIGLSLSGGGYRAASFHLGAMSYLNWLNFKGKPLLENVKIISTVSGGTITGIIYALRKQRAESFETIYDFILQKLYSMDLVKAGINKLNPEGIWDNPYKNKNLINAFAELYDKELTEGKTFSEFTTMRSHLEAVVFNSTEFDNAINFRFRDANSGYFGNYKIRINPKAADEVKLSDAMASSSCFTGGFEPMIWPDDFCYDGADNIIKEKKEKRNQLGLMDGGIYDNQGIESILNYQRKEGADPYLDLIIVSDVTSPYMKGYRPYADQPNEGLRKLTLKKINKKVSFTNNVLNTVLISLIAILTLVPLLNGYTMNWLTGLCMGLSFAFLAVFIAKLVILSVVTKMLMNFINSILNRIPEFYREKLSNLKIEELSVRRLEPLIFDRLNSLLNLLMNVFLKVVRRLNYFKLYDNYQYKYRRITNLVRELTEEDFSNKRARNDVGASPSNKHSTNTILNGTYEKIVGSKIKNIAEEAASFGTTLWFKDKNELDNLLNKLVASGQCTMCYNMLEYLEVIIFEEDNGFDKLDQSTKDAITNVYNQCKADWLDFKIDPLFMYNKLSKAYQHNVIHHSALSK